MTADYLATLRAASIVRRMVEQPLGRSTLGALALLTGAIVAAQIVLSRLLASTLGYYFAFMLVSLAMLGLASGALLVHARVQWFRRDTLERDAAVLSLLCAICASGGGLAYLQVYAPAPRPPLFAWLAPAFLCFFPFFLWIAATFLIGIACYGAGWVLLAGLTAVRQPLRPLALPVVISP